VDTKLKIVANHFTRPDGFTRTDAAIRSSTLTGVVGKPKVSDVGGRGGMAVGNRDPQRHCTTTETVGWKAGCNCGANATIPCTVLDPFAGSGTTLAVAKDLGRRALGCEMSADYVEIIEGRMGLITPDLFGGVA
jgi:hypothetical protein